MTTIFVLFYNLVMMFCNPIDSSLCNINFSKKKFKKNKLIQPTNTNLQKNFDKNILNLLDKIRKIADANGVNVFLSGGTVRDCLLGEKVNDLDCVINGDAINFAKRLKNAEQKTFKHLFIRPSVGRVTVFTPTINIDINSLTETGEVIKDRRNLNKALRANINKNSDFTINSMLIELTGDMFNFLKMKFYDPMHAKNDLKENKLKAVSPESISDDPIRLLRWERFKIKYDMKTDAQTYSYIKEALVGTKNKKNSYYYRLVREYLKIFMALVKKII